MKYMRLTIVPAIIMGLVLVAIALSPLLASAQSSTDVLWLPTHYVAKLSGANEVPPVGSGSVSGENYIGTTTLATTTPSVTGGLWGNFFMRTDADMSKAQFVLDVFDGTEVVEAHLHCGAPGQNGPVIAHLFGRMPGGIDVNGELSSFILSDRNIIKNSTTTTNGTPTAVGGCAMPVTDIKSLVALVNADQVYANVHTVGYPDGAARGQLMATVNKDANSTSFLDVVEKLFMLDFDLRKNFADLRDRILNTLDLFVEA